MTDTVSSLPIGDSFAISTLKKPINGLSETSFPDLNVTVVEEPVQGKTARPYPSTHFRLEDHPVDERRNMRVFKTFIVSFTPPLILSR